MQEAEYWEDQVNLVASFLLEEDELPASRSAQLPPTVSDPRVNILLIRGLSWRDDTTFSALESMATDLGNVNFIRFGYNGFQNPNEANDYSPRDLLSKKMEVHVNSLNMHVRALLSTWSVPLYLVAHSFGTLVTANWVCQPQAQDIVSRIPAICLIGGPLFPPKGKEVTVEIRDRKRNAVYEYVHRPVGVDRRRIFLNYPHVVVNIIGKRDKVAPEKYASLQDYAHQSAAGERLIQPPPLPTNHISLPNHPEAIALITNHFQLAAP